MSRTALLVVGGGPAGHSAAGAYRDAGGDGAVVLVTAEGRLPYERPPLSKDLLRGETEPAEIGLADAAWYTERGIDVRFGAVAAIDPDARAATLDDGTEVAFATCVLATGAEPVQPPVAGVDLPGVHLLRTLPDALALRGAARAGARVVVVGSGFIGCEAAASLRRRGCEVTLMSEDPTPQQPRLGDEVGARLAGWLDDADVEARLGVSLTAITDGRSGLCVEVSRGAPIDTDLVLLAVGVRPRGDVADAAGLDLTDAGEIPVDAAMRTTAGHVLACGDCALAHHVVADRPVHVEHWGDALAQGTVAGTAAAGADAAWTTVPGFWSTIGDRTLKYAAWGDGFDTVEVRDHGGGAFTAWYGADGRCVGVLAHERDDDYERGRDLIADGAPLP